MSKKTKAGKGNELLEDPSAIVEKINKSEEFFKKNKNILTYVMAAVVLIVGGTVFFRQQKKQENLEAQVKLIHTVYAFEEDSLDIALRGRMQGEGLPDIAEEHSGTAAGELASYYTGVAFLKKGNYEDAISYLKEFKPKDVLVQARVWSLIGDAYMEQNDVDNAISYYEKAADHEPNDQFTPRYLFKAALAYEKNNDYKEAAKKYDRVINEFHKSAEVTDAKKYKARAEALASN